MNSPKSNTNVGRFKHWQVVNALADDGNTLKFLAKFKNRLILSENLPHPGKLPVFYQGARRECSATQPLNQRSNPNIKVASYDETLPMMLADKQLNVRIQ